MLYKTKFTIFFMKTWIVDQINAKRVLMKNPIASAPHVDLIFVNK